jgi:hypothetical protein
MKCEKLTTAGAAAPSAGTNSLPFDAAAAAAAAAPDAAAAAAAAAAASAPVPPAPIHLG